MAFLAFCVILLFLRSFVWFSCCCGARLYFSSGNQLNFRVIVNRCRVTMTNEQSIWWVLSVFVCFSYHFFVCWLYICILCITFVKQKLISICRLWITWTTLTVVRDRPLNLTLNVRGPSYLGLTRSISWLLMPWLLTSPGHQQPWNWLCKRCRSWSYLREDFKYTCHINVE